ncbi:hypothetical protein PDENDC454_10770 [Paenibacillus dendritiformis C454]|uniref:Uncharacterized protein n=1 Tax=Paenibacillus dendritiformis C454 TaxID=1131935 RepID=H3SF49_9BACL|nr:hypothetical protein PDENDC454_10770 [Paenibacillus dendritiformis C454]
MSPLTYTFLLTRREIVHKKLSTHTFPLTRWENACYAIRRLHIRLTAREKAVTDDIISRIKKTPRVR